MLPHPAVEDIARILHRCTQEKHRSCGLSLHAFVQRYGLSAHASLGNRLVSMLVEIGSIHDAQTVFDRLVRSDKWSWNALISGYIKSGRPQEAFSLYQEMQTDGCVYPSGHTFAALLKACMQLKDWVRGLELHAEVARIGLVEKNVFIGSTLVHMYVKCGFLAKAQQAFDSLPSRDTVLWTALMTGYLENGLGEEAIECFDRMQSDGLSPDAITVACALKACGSIGAVDKGQEIHVEIERHGVFTKDMVVGNTLVDMYAKFDLLSLAQEVFERLTGRNVVSWNALITGYAEHGHGEEALKRFEQMRQQGVPPDSVTLIVMVKACSSIGAIEKGGEIYNEIESVGLEKDLVVAGTLVDMYAKCGSLAMAQHVFDKLSLRDAILWTALMAGYAEHGLGEQALSCLEQMQLEGVPPNAVTFVCSLKACGSTGAVDKGAEIHAEIERQGLLDKDLVLGNSLVDMYAKCGLLAKARQVFDALQTRDIISWNALITGYAQHGDSNDVLHILERMLEENMKPDPVTFIVILSACIRADLLNKSETYFETMSKEYGVIPSLKHHACLVDHFCRAGHLDRATTFIREMPLCPNLVMWRAILSGCRKWGNFEFGKHAFEHVVSLDKKDAAAYIFMSQISAGANIWEKGPNSYPNAKQIVNEPGTSMAM